MKQPNLSTEKLNQAMQSPAVRAALAAKAERVLPRAKSIALQDGKRQFAQALTVRQGTRPGTGSPSGLLRSFARVEATVTEDMRKIDGYGRLTRQQILRRATDA